ncbi:MAG: CHRD domain-containing protein [Proteobacteria bacterium]|nr:CHRD domain-containing protein [Pseudomonadota bacterium]
MNIVLRTIALATALGLAGAATAQEVNLRGVLSGGNVISATESPATGEVAAVLAEDGTLQLDLVFAGLEPGATGAALHTGRYNENGPAVAELDVKTGATEGRIAGAQLSLTPLEAADVRAGESYVVISTIENPAGAVRGQLMPQPARLGDTPPAAVQMPAPVAPAVEPAPVEETAPAEEAAPVDEPEEDE